MKPSLLFLCHRIPYPPNKGDKIRSYHLLKFLSQHYQVYLGTFVDDPEDWQYQSLVAEICAESCFIKLDPRAAKLKSMLGFFTNEALSLPYYKNKKLDHWVKEITAEHHIEKLVVYSSVMAQYAMTPNVEFTNTVIDFVDIDSDKWQQYSTRKKWPLNWVYSREAKKLLSYEQKVAKKFDSSLFVSLAEAEMFKQLCPQSEQKVSFYNNGVDTEYFSPDIDLHNPYQSTEQVLVFTGAMDYWPNVDAVTWFAKQVFPGLKQRNPDLKFYIVGSKPTDEVQKLGNSDIIVTGRVPDVRPYLKYAIAAVAPMRIARGIQNKVLEAMAMARPTIVTGQALEGIQAAHRQEVLLGNDEKALQLLVQQVVDGEHVNIATKARDKVISDFSWEDNLPIVGALLEKPTN